MLMSTSLRLCILTGAAVLTFATLAAFAPEPRDDYQDKAPAGGRSHLPPPGFEEMDSDKNGVISRAEFDAFRASHKPPVPAGDLPPPPPGGQPMRGPGPDSNGDGKISFEEFSAPLKAHFDRLDVNRDGMLDAGEQEKLRSFEPPLRK